MGKNKQYRECEECGAPIDSHNPSTRLCKRCEVAHRQSGSKYRSKDHKKRKKKSKDEEFFEGYENYYEDS